MNSKYKTVITISALIFILSIVISIINYNVALKNAHNQLKNQSLPLTLDNIYTDIQKNIIEPYLVSSMMANDTFVQDWIVHDEESADKISKYLETIKNKYNMFNTFLVSEFTKNYYTQDGFIEKISQENSHNQWYYNFKATTKKHEINLDTNKNLSNNLIMFINYKILDNNFKYLGATGVAIKISYISEMLRNFRINHKFTVSFVNPQGKIVLAEDTLKEYKNIQNIPEFSKLKDQILLKNSQFIEYNKKSQNHILSTKYIPELDLYLLVDANLDDFTKDVKNMFYFNIIISLLIAIIVSFIILFIIRGYSSKLEFLSHNDVLTAISNRRDFEEKLQQQIKIHRRKQETLALIFLDIDNFKTINDNFGHNTGDEVLKQTAHILKNTIRSTDLIARWGGEEFTIALVDVNSNELESIMEKIRISLETDQTLFKLVNYSITASLGVSILKQSDTLHSFITRADEQMYHAKKNGKNCYFIDKN